MSLTADLTKLAGEGFVVLGIDASFGEVVVSNRAELAQFQCNGAMAAAKSSDRPPREIAEQVARHLERQDDIATAQVAGPGFINIVMTDEALVRAGSAAGKDLGYVKTSNPLKVIVDYAGPNVAKAMHVGHLRATIIGDSLARLFAFAGHDVIRDPHFGDWGFQMGLLISVVKEEGIDPATITLEDLQEIYPRATARSDEDASFAERARAETVRLQSRDPESVSIWQQMKTVSEASQREDFAALGVNFDLWYGESDVHDRLASLADDLESRGVAEVSDGALVVYVDREDDNREWPPLILKSSAGGFLYTATDVATLDMRVTDLEADLVLYVVDNRQSDHFTQVFRTIRKAGLASDDAVFEHIGFGTMNGPDNRPFKTRAGGVVRLADVVEMITTAAKNRLDEAHLAEEYPETERNRIASQVGVAALKFGDLINYRGSDYRFDLDRFSSFEGKTGPNVQYTAVRIRSILAKASERNVEAGKLGLPGSGTERSLVLELLNLPDVVDRAVELRDPHLIAEYAHLLAGRYNRFYDQHHILSESDPAQQGSWLALSQWSLDTLVTLLDLLGIEVPHRM